MARVPVYLEVGKKRTFAGALEWPGWARAGRDEEAALETLAAYARRYGGAMGRVARDLPEDPAGFDVVERLDGDATTDFGAPSRTPTSDERPVDEREAKRLAALLRASWRTFDHSADDAAGATLRRGPRGGGRHLEAIVEHVLGAEGAYLSRLGGAYRAGPGGDVEERMEGVREAFVHAFILRARGEPPPKPPRSAKLWAPRYAVRRSAWHALDHAWEIEDRVEPE